MRCWHREEYRTISNVSQHPIKLPNFHFPIYTVNAGFLEFESSPDSVTLLCHLYHHTIDPEMGQPISINATNTHHKTILCVEMHSVPTDVFSWRSDETEINSQSEIPRTVGYLLNQQLRTSSPTNTVCCTALARLSLARSVQADGWRSQGLIQPTATISTSKTQSQPWAKL